MEVFGLSLCEQDEPKPELPHAVRALMQLGLFGSGVAKHLTFAHVANNWQKYEHKYGLQDMRKKFGELPALRC